MAGVEVRIVATNLTKFARELGKIDKPLRAELTKSLKATGEKVADRARDNASWSTRVPQSIKVRARSLQITIIADPRVAPEAAPLENKGRDGFFRHPLFGDREIWVDQKARPFLAPALRTVDKSVLNEMSDALDHALRASGLT